MDFLDDVLASCTKCGCHLPAAAVADLCDDCSFELYHRREQSGSPALVNSDERDVIPLQEVEELSRQITTRLRPQDEATFARRWAHVLSVSRDAGATVPFGPREVKWYAFQHLQDRGIERTRSDLPDSERVVQSTFVSEMRWVDIGHERAGHPPPWSTFKGTDEGRRFWHSFKNHYLKAKAGLAKDALELPDWIRLLDHLATPTAQQRRVAALVAVAADPHVVDERGRRVGYSFWSDLDRSEVYALGDGSLVCSAKSYRERTVVVPSGFTAETLRAAVLTWAPLDGDAEGTAGPLLDDALAGPLFVSSSNRGEGQPLNAKDGARRQIVHALTNAGQVDDLEPYLVKVGRARLVTFGLDEAEHRVGLLLQPQPAEQKMAAYLANAYFILARKQELASRRYWQATITSKGVVWRLTRKMDKTGRAPNYGAPHLVYTFCDPTTLLRRWRSTLIRIRKKKGLHDNLRDAPLFPGNLSKPSVPAIPNATLNNRLTKYAAQVGLDHLNLATHSIRSGFANSARYLGVDDAEIMMAGGWKDVSVFQSYMRQMVPLDNRSAPIQLANRSGLLAATPEDSFRANVAQAISDAAARHSRCSCNVCVVNDEVASSPRELAEQAS